MGIFVDNSVGLGVARITGFEVGITPPTITGIAVVCCIGVFVEDLVGPGVTRLPGLAVGVTTSTISGESEAVGCCSPPGDCVGDTINPSIVSVRFPKILLTVNETFKGICDGEVVGWPVVGDGRGLTLGRLLDTAVGAMEDTRVGDRDGLVVAASIGSALAICLVSAKGPTIKCDANTSKTGSCTAA